MDAEAAKQWMKDNDLWSGEPLRELTNLSARIDEQGTDELDEEWPAAWYASVQRVRELADVYEATLIRLLRAGEGPSGQTTWASVAEAVDSHLGSRQAAQQKWKRLLAENRREYGGPGRGGRPKVTQGDVNESTTP